MKRALLALAVGVVLPNPGTARDAGDPPASPEVSGADLRRAAFDPAAESGVVFVPREDWDPAWDSTKFKYQPLGTPDEVTIHHTAAKVKGTSEEEVVKVKNGHRKKGWNDIAYHFLVGPDGRVFEGRPEGALGSHVKDDNTRNIGIVFLGDYGEKKKGADPSAWDQLQPVQRRAAVELLLYLHAAYPALRKLNLSAHREVGATRTACPGENVYAELGKFRATKEWDVVD